ncbi:methyltransferase domain-containing protein [Candidatus Babeliales bacterium]|nr:methyltransferase domain-containing protein [Candidatus Babeliales bacterium]
MTTLHSGVSDVKIQYLTKFVKAPSVLDLGAGNCQYSKWIKLMHPDIKITAVDHASSDVPDGVLFQCLDIEKKLPFEDQSFETIIAFDILEHIDSVDNLLDELFRVLKPGGIILGSVPHDEDHFLPAYNLTFYHRSDVTHKRYYVPKTLIKTVTKHGFINTETWLEGGVSPAVFAEFFPRLIKPIVKKAIGLFRRLKIIRTDVLKSDLFFTAYKEDLRKL